MGGAGSLLVVPQTDTDLGLLDTHPTIDLMQVSLLKYAHEIWKFVHSEIRRLAKDIKKVVSLYNRPTA